FSVLGLFSEAGQPALRRIAEDGDMLIGVLDHGPRQQVRGFTRSEPFALIGDSNRDDFVLTRIQSVDDRFGGTQRNLVFAGTPPEDYPDFEFLRQNCSLKSLMGLMGLMGLMRFMGLMRLMGLMGLMGLNKSYESHKSHKSH